ncbi:predicted protein [Plenodomus lingam JN3]|uniref:Predicted protein n=1 Tax=Leptosphaeria maculans (strain JN3 / isolate v23.1.3 / race Av1-4-5-6-7-8) TaxID=985895 RepID=E4ZPX5_LEPMJ|nr:predicted protein [Plenodomus lingam JN3]CBX93510.1 predicted protein [Plenodomus lingam JN3]
MPSSAPHRCTGSAGDECLPCQTCHCIVVHTKTLVPPYPPVPPETAAQSRKLLDVGFSSEVTNCAAKGMLHGVHVYIEASPNIVTNMNSVTVSTPHVQSNPDPNPNPNPKLNITSALPAPPRPNNPR